MPSLESHFSGSLHARVAIRAKGLAEGGSGAFRREAARLGGEKPPPAADPVPRKNKRTGEVQEVDRRLDPAWATNLAKHRSSALRDALNVRIAGRSAEPSTQRAAVQTVLGSPVLDGFLDEVRRFRQRHPGANEVPRRIKDLIERAEPLPEKNARTLVYLTEINGRLYRAAVKATRSHEIYLTTFHRAKPRDRRRARQRAASVQRERER